ncbi:hypothetical protein JCM8547_005109 [Rhodosporidiobolus lusitaniae]
MARSLLALAFLAQLAAAQYRFPCSEQQADGSFDADGTQCLPGNITPTGEGDPSTGNKGDGVTPVDSICAFDSGSGLYWCGGPGATCLSDENCDNGYCAGGTCQGTFGQACNGDDFACLGFVYCLDANYDSTPSNTCGGNGAFCQDPLQVDPSYSDAEAQALFNSVCASGFCNSRTAMCAARSQPGEDCSADPEYSCVSGTVCDYTTYTCVNPAPSTTTTTSPPQTTTTTTSVPTTTTTTSTTSSSPSTPSAGGLGYPCSGDDNLCTDGSYCTDASANPTTQDVCGGEGSFCDSNANCVSGYCSPFVAECAANPNGGTTTTTSAVTTTTTTTTSSGITPPPATTEAPPSSVFTVSGTVSTSRPIAEPVSVSCANSGAYASCQAGAAYAASCCPYGSSECSLIFSANSNNCDQVGQASYPCTSTSSSDVEDCCSTVFAAFFGTGGGDPCAL